MPVRKKIQKPKKPRRVRRSKTSKKDELLQKQKQKQSVVINLQNPQQSATTPRIIYQTHSQPDYTTQNMIRDLQTKLTANNTISNTNDLQNIQNQIVNSSNALQNQFRLGNSNLATELKNNITNGNSALATELKDNITSGNSALSNYLDNRLMEESDDIQNSNINFYNLINQKILDRTLKPVPSTVLSGEGNPYSNKPLNNSPNPPEDNFYDYPVKPNNRREEEEDTVINNADFLKNITKLKRAKLVDLQDIALVHNIDYTGKSREELISSLSHLVRKQPKDKS